MSPRSYTYSGGDLNPYRERPSYGNMSSVAYGTEPTATLPTQPAQRSGGFWEGLNRVAGAIAPIAEAAAAFKRGYQGGFPLPGRSPNDSRMAGDRFIFQILEDMRQRNEAAAERARADRQSSRQEDARTKVILAGIESGQIDPKEALKILGGGLTPKATPESGVGLPAPQSSVYTDDILDNEPEAWGGRPRG